MNELELKLAYLGYLVLDTKLCNNNSDDLLAPLLLSYKSLGYKLDQNSYEVLRKVNEELTFLNPSISSLSLSISSYLS